MSQQNAKPQGRETFPVYEQNPSTARAMQSMAPKSLPSMNGGKTMIVGADTGEVLGEGSVMFLENKIVDRQPFSKVYAGELGRLLGLPKSGRRVLEMVHAIISTKPGVDYVPLHPNVCEQFGETMSRRTFDRGVNELLAERLLYRSLVPHHYYVDVTVMFNGDRVVLAKVYTRERAQIEQQQQQMTLLEHDDMGDIEDTQS